MGGISSHTCTPRWRSGNVSPVSSFGPGQEVTPEFRQAFLAGWINFITKHGPSNLYLGGGASENGTWPLYDNLQAQMVNFNTVGGECQDTYDLSGFNILNWLVERMI